jgi:hypothetical protein
MTHQISLLSWRIEKRSNFGCTQSLVSRHSSLLTSGPRRSVKQGQRVDQGVGRMSQHLGDAAHECRYPAAGRPSSLRGGLIIATSEAASQHDRGSVKPPDVHGSSQNAYRTRPPAGSGRCVRSSRRWPAAMAPHLPRATRDLASSSPLPVSIAATSWALCLNAPSARGNISGRDRQAVTHDTGSRRLPKLVSETSRAGRTTLSDSIKTPSALPSVASSTSAIALSSGASRIW